MGSPLADARLDEPRPRLPDEDFLSLERLSRKAAHDSLRARSGHLAEDQFDSLAVHLLGIGIRAFERFDPALTVSERDGFSFAYREMRGYRRGQFTNGPYIDWLRTNVRDSRFEPEASTSLTESGALPESTAHEEAPLEAVVEHFAAGLSERDAWTLRHVATALAGGYTLAEVMESLIADLADALAPQLPERNGSAHTLSSFEELFSDWIEEAAA